MKIKTRHIYCTTQQVQTHGEASFHFLVVPVVLINTCFSLPRRSCLSLPFYDRQIWGDSITCAPTGKATFTTKPVEPKDVLVLFLSILYSNFSPMINYRHNTAFHENFRPKMKKQSAIKIYAISMSSTPAALATLVVLWLD